MGLRRPPPRTGLLHVAPGQVRFSGPESDRRPVERISEGKDARVAPQSGSPMGARGDGPRGRIAGAHAIDATPPGVLPRVSALRRHCLVVEKRDACVMFACEGPRGEEGACSIGRPHPTSGEADATLARRPVLRLLGPASSIVWARVASALCASHAGYPASRPLRPSQSGTTSLDHQTLKSAKLPQTSRLHKARRRCFLGPSRPTPFTSCSARTPSKHVPRNPPMPWTPHTSKASS